MESQAEYLERARAAFKIKSDSHIAREIGITRQYLHRFKNNEIQLGEAAMIKLAERAGLDVDEALVLRALWASQIDTIPNYAKYLRKFAGCFPYIITGLLAYEMNNYKPLNYNENLEVTRESELHVINIMRLSWKRLAQFLHLFWHGRLFAHQRPAPNSVRTSL